MVLWRVLFANVSALVAQNGQNSNMFGDEATGDGPKRRNNAESSGNINGLLNGQFADIDNNGDPIVEELNGVRSREITSKAVSGVILILLKWFKLSRKP